MDAEKLRSLGLHGVMGDFAASDDNYIEEVEMTAGFRFPDDYRQFVKSYGVSAFSGDVYFRPLVPSSWAMDGLEGLDVFYGKSADPIFDLLRTNVRLKDAIPKGTIAIGYDSGSNHIILAPTGAVHFFDCDSSRQFLCANDFASFLNSFERVGGLPDET
jgi:hypothetical protein